MTVTIELGGQRDKAAVRWRAKVDSKWSAWNQLTKRAEYLVPGDYQVAAGEGQDEPDQNAIYEVKSLRKGYGGAVDGMEHFPPRRLSPLDINVIFNFN